MTLENQFQTIKEAFNIKGNGFKTQYGNVNFIFTEKKFNAFISGDVKGFNNEVWPCSKFGSIQITKNKDYIENILEFISNCFYFELTTPTEEAHKHCITSLNLY